MYYFSVDTIPKVLFKIGWKRKYKCNKIRKKKEREISKTQSIYIVENQTSSLTVEKEILI